MITEEVIKEIYKNYSKPPKDQKDLDLPYFAELLKPHHDLNVTDDEVIVMNIDEFSPFKRFLTRSLNAVLDFDQNVAFVFKTHILFFSKKDDRISVNFKPEKEKSGFFNRLFGRD